MKESAKTRISKAVERWYIHEPLLFGIWTTHCVVLNNHIQTIRSGRGLVEYNPAFIGNLDKKQLSDVLHFEALRILLKHPYSRRKDIPNIAYKASNIAIQEHVGFKLNFPTAFAVFQTHNFDNAHFEFYYRKLLELAEKKKSIDKGCKSKDRNELGDPESGDEQGDPESGDEQGDPESGDEQGDPKSGDGQGDPESGDGHDAAESPSNQLGDYADPDVSGSENTETWEVDEYHVSQINDKIEDTMNSFANNSWGSIPRDLAELVIAGLKPKLNFRHILKSFRASILSSNRRLTRMRPSRRYEFLYMGSRRDFTTRLLFAVDVSGSVENKDLENACSIIMRLFKYGIEQVDVIQFDTEIKGAAQTLKKAARSLKVLGRGGTNFQPVMDYISENREYDGLIIFTDGMAPAPELSLNRKTRILWLFNNEDNYESQKKRLCPWHRAAFLIGRE